MSQMRKTIALAAVATVLGWTAGGYAQENAPKGNAENGKSLFLKDGCYQCHGFGAQGASATGPRLGPDPLPFDAFLRQLRQPAQEMPSYEAAILTDQQAADIHAYLGTIPKSPDWRTIPLLKDN